MGDDDQNSVEANRCRQASALVEQLLLANSARDADVVQDLLNAHPQLRVHLDNELQKLERIEGALGLAPSTANFSSTVSSSSPASLRLSIPGYEILGRIGAGGQAAVFRATQLSTSQTVAIKAIYGGAFHSESAKKRFDREVRILVELNHPNIVHVIDRGTTDEGTPFVVMRYVDGQDLDEWLKSRRARPLTHDLRREVDQLVISFVKICEAVDAAHQQGIVHRDLKPSNIRMDARDQPHILDFGLARVGIVDENCHLDIAAAEGRTQTGQFVGSLPWASPEQIGAVQEPVRATSDVFSLGMILFEMLTKVHPYDTHGSLRDLLGNIESVGLTPPSAALTATGFSAAQRTIHPVLDAIVVKALALAPGDRYASAGELADDLRCYLQGRPTVASQARRSYAMWIAKAIGLGTGAVALMFWYILSFAPPSITVRGVVWNDLNGDGFRQPEEAGLSAAMVFADLNGNGVADRRSGATRPTEPFAWTDENGKYELAIQAAPAMIRCQPQTTLVPTHPQPLRQREKNIFVFAEVDSVRVLTRSPGEMLDVQRGRDLWLPLRNQLPETVNVIAENVQHPLNLFVIDDRQLIVGWVRDKRYLARLTVQNVQPTLQYLGSLPLERNLMDVGDINGDGWYDLLIRSREGVPNDEDNWSVQCCWGRVDGTFDLTTPLQMVAQRHRGFLAWLEDVNEDGVLDLLFQEMKSGGYFTFELKVADGFGDGTFDVAQARTLLRGPPNHGLSSQHPVDLDNDGDRDVVLFPDDDTQDEGQSHVAVNQGHGRYELKKFIDFVPENEAGGQDLSVIDYAVLLDLDQDGHLDLLATIGYAAGNPVRLYRQIDQAIDAGAATEQWPSEVVDLSTYWTRIAWPLELAKSPGQSGVHIFLSRRASGHFHRDFGFQSDAR